MDKLTVPLLLDTRTAAQRYGVSKSFLEHLRMTPNCGPQFIKIGRKVLYRIVDLDAWMDKKICRGGHALD